MTLSRIIYITHPLQNYESLKWVHNLHEAGINWIQLRIKEEDFRTENPNGHFQVYFLEVAEKLRAVTSALNMTLSINDNDSIYNIINADGLHLGLSDKNLKEIHKNQNSIIGVSANEINNLENYDLSKVDYIGVGPYRNTSTKKDTKTPLGLIGYSNFINNLKVLKISKPIFAIGGISKTDISAIMETGVYGIALSNEIFINLESINELKQIVNLTEK